MPLMHAIASASSEPDAVNVLQQIARAAEPREKSGQCANVEPRQLRSRCDPLACVQMQMRQMQMAVARKQRQPAQREPDNQTDEIKVGPGHERFLNRRIGGALRAFQHFHQALGKARVFQNFAQQNQTQAGIGMARHGEQRLVQFEVAREALRAGDQPEVEFVFERADIGYQFILEALGVVHQIARMDLKEARQQHPRGVRQMWPRAGFDLRKIALGDGFPKLLLDQAREFQLRELAVQAAQVPSTSRRYRIFSPESYCNLRLVYCNL